MLQTPHTLLKPPHSDWGGSLKWGVPLYHSIPRWPTRSTDPVLVEPIVSPDWFSRLCIQHRSHDLVKSLVRVSLQHDLLISVDETSAKSYNDTLVGNDLTTYPIYTCMLSRDQFQDELELITSAVGVGIKIWQKVIGVVIEHLIFYSAYNLLSDCVNDSSICMKRKEIKYLH